MSEKEARITSAEDTIDAKTATERQVSFAGPALDDDDGDADSVRRDGDENNDAVHHSSLLTMSIHNDIHDPQRHKRPVGEKEFGAIVRCQIQRGVNLPQEEKLEFLGLTGESQISEREDGKLK